MLLYFPGRSLLHRAPASWKLFTLFLLSLLSLVFRSPITVYLLLATAVALTILSRVPIKNLVKALIPSTIISLLLAGYHLYRSDVPTAISYAGTFFALIWLALLMTSTSTVSALAQALSKAVSLVIPSKALANHLELTISLMMRELQSFFVIFTAMSEGRKARDISPTVTNTGFPFVLKVVSRAKENADALNARGLAD